MTQYVLQASKAPRVACWITSQTKIHLSAISEQAAKNLSSTQAPSRDVELILFAMPLNSDNQLEHEPAAKTDPAHASSKNTDHVTSSGEKPTSLVEFVTDTSFIPTLAGAPLAQKVKSYLLLFLLVFGSVTTLWFFDFTLFQTALDRSSTVVEGPIAPPPPTTFLDAAKEVGLMTAGVSAVIMALLFFTGTSDVDYWSLVMEYGWYTIPIVAGVGLFFVMSKENTEYIADVA